MATDRYDEIELSSVIFPYEAARRVGDAGEVQLPIVYL